jgi:hypothetical protein
MRSLKLTLNLVMIMLLLAILSGGCTPSTPTLDVVTLSPNATVNSTPTTTIPPAVPPTPTPKLPTDLPGQQGDPGNTGAVDQELPLAIEPKWLSPSFLGMGNYNSWPVVSDDEMVVVAGASVSPYPGIVGILDSFDSGDISILYALNLADGEQKWVYHTGGVLMGTPQIALGRVYVVTRQRATSGEEAFASKIHCLKAEDGSLVWQHILPKSNAGALTVQDGVVLLLSGMVDVKNGRAATLWGEETPVHALGFDADTGEPLWSAPLLNKSSFSLEPPTVADGRAFVVDLDHLYGLDLQTGQQLWQFEHEGEQDPGFPNWEFSGALVAAEGNLFVADLHKSKDYSLYYNSIYALDPASGGILWHYKMASTSTQGANGGMSYHLGKLFTWGTWNQGNDQFDGLIALKALDGSEVWHTVLGDKFEYPPTIGNNGWMLAGSFNNYRLIEEGTGQILWDGDYKHEPNMGVSYAMDWSPTFTYGIQYPNPPREAWLPNEWVLDPNGETVLLAGFKTWRYPPALSGGVVIGLTTDYKTESRFGFRLVAYGADSTSPDARISDIGLGHRNIQLTDIFGTAYDYNLKEWSLELGKGTPPSGWEVLAHSTSATQDFLANLRIGGHPRQIGDGVWTLRLVVTDNAGLTSRDEWTFTNDWTAPGVEISEPKDGATIAAGEFILNGTASDTNGITQVRITFDNGKTFTLADGTTQWTLPITVTQAMEGKSVTYYAEAMDTFGNVGKSNLVTLTFPKFQVGLQAGGRRLVSTYSMFVDPTGDIDGDGINQRWENAAMQLTIPILELDEEEDWLNQYHENIFGQYTKPKYPMVYFVRVTGDTPESYTLLNPQPSYPTYILFYYVFGWAKDYGAVGGGLEAHRGDSENIIMAWRVTNETTAELEWVRTSSHKDVNRHHGLWNSWQRSCTLANIAINKDVTGDTEMMCADLEFEANGRLVLYPGEDKHALYPNADMCSNHVKLLTVGYGEDCGWDPLKIDGKLVPGQWKDSDFDQDDRYLGNGRWLFEAYNVGEPDQCRKNQLIDFLDQPETWRNLTDAQKQALTGLYPNEAVWSGTFGKQAQWDPEKKCTLVLDIKGNPVESGSEFCGGLQPGGDTDEPDVCSSKLGGALGQADDWTDKGPPDLIPNAMDARYQVTIKTGDIDRAGTDAMISLALSFGSGDVFGDTIKVYSGLKFYYQPLISNYNPIKAPYSYVGSFEQGDTDYIYLNGYMTGDITGIRLSQDGMGDGPGWFVEQIIVRDLLTGKVWAARPNKWLASDVSPNTTSSYIPLYSYHQGMFSKIDYQVIVTTGDLSGAGTDGDVSIMLIAEDGSTSDPLKLENKSGIFGFDFFNFQSSKLDTFTVTSADIGSLGSLRVQLNPKGNSSDWYCREVTVRNPITGQVWVFPIESWLGRGNGPLSVEKPANN